MSFAPVALFTYNRPEHTRQTLEALANNEGAAESDLWIFSDGPKRDADLDRILEVRRVAEGFPGFKSVKLVVQEKNQGLANSIIAGVSQVVEEAGRVIVLEDDLVTSPYFLNYMNQGLDYYESSPKVFSVTAYNHPPHTLKIYKAYPHDVYFSSRPDSCGWGTWKECWEKAEWEVLEYKRLQEDMAWQQKFNQTGADKFLMMQAQMEGKIDSWAIRWDYSHMLHDAVCVHPRHSLILNIGFDGTGIHSSNVQTQEHAVDLELAQKSWSWIPYEGLDPKIIKAIYRCYTPSFVKKVQLKLKRMVMS